MQPSLRWNSRPLEFLKGFLRNPKEVGSVIPSSRFLTRRVLQCANVRQARVIVELGPGTGVLTAEILRRMSFDATLIAIEINPEFVRLLRQAFDDLRLVVHEGSCVDLEAALAAVGSAHADLVVSGIPFSTLDPSVRHVTLEAARRLLAPSGRFVAYQFRSHVRHFADAVFGPGMIQHEFLNLPPMRIFTWQKHVTAA